MVLFWLLINYWWLKIKKINAEHLFIFRSISTCTPCVSLMRRYWTSCSSFGGSWPKDWDGTLTPLLPWRCSQRLCALSLMDQVSTSNPCCYGYTFCTWDHTSHDTSTLLHYRTWRFNQLSLVPARVGIFRTTFLILHWSETDIWYGLCTFYKHEYCIIRVKCVSMHTYNTFAALVIKTLWNSVLRLFCE